MWVVQVRKPAAFYEDLLPGETADVTPALAHVLGNDDDRAALDMLMGSVEQSPTVKGCDAGDSVGGKDSVGGSDSSGDGAVVGDTADDGACPSTSRGSASAAAGTEDSQGTTSRDRSSSEATVAATKSVPPKSTVQLPSASASMSQIAVLPEDVTRDARAIPRGAVDEDEQQLDLRETNSWQMGLGDISTAECVILMSCID